MLELNKTIKACQAGKRSAQKALYEHFAPRMLGVCMRYAPNKEEAEDFLQEGFIHAFEKIEQFRFQGSFEGWLRRLMINMIIQSLRNKRYLEEIPLEGPVDESQLEASQDFDDDFSLDVLMDAVAGLPERYRAVFNLFVFEEMSHAEIAGALNISEGTSKSNLWRARKWLQQHLAKVNKEYSDDAGTRYR